MVERYRPQKNIMRRFRITELSGVDKPAQEAALATLMKRAPGYRKIMPLTPEQRAAATIPLRHDDDPDANKMLKLEGITALTYGEAEYSAKLTTDARRAFLLADHEARKGMMNEESAIEDDEMNDFKQAVEKFTASGLPRTAAMRKARAAYPALFAKYQQAPAQADVAKAAQAEADAIRKGAERRATLDAAITERMMAKKVTRLDALRSLRREQPEMFEEA